ncbi:MAG: hypothetical protein NC093_09380 [Alistipes sp.]|nr:hypothetical protein [Alistipes sp.]
MKKIVSIFMACLVFCSVGGVTASAAVPPDNGGIVSPCYLYTDRASSYLTISGGTASCKSTIYGISGTTTKIVVTQILQKKDGNSWTEVTSWNKTFNNWYCSYPNSHSLTNKGTYRVKTVAKVYKGTAYETVTTYSTEVTY